VENKKLKDKRNPVITTFKQAKRLIIAVIGFTILLFGLLLVIPGIPGPGIVVIILGLAILGTEFVWAKKLLKRFKNQANNFKNSFLNKREGTENRN
jgi:tellurite resistance protein TerC